VKRLCGSTADVLGLNDALPAYSALSTCMPAGLSGIEQLPVPIGFSMPTHDCIVLELTVTVPVGISPLGLVTLKVISTDWPGADGSGLSLVIVVTVVAGPTRCGSTAEVLGPNPPPPPYEAVNECEPEALNAIVQLPEPIGFSIPTHDCIVLELTVTEPAGVPLMLLTLKVISTDWPTTDGSGLSLVIVVVVVGEETVCGSAAEDSG
jgi:hypothetical protein